MLKKGCPVREVEKRVKAINYPKIEKQKKTTNTLTEVHNSAKKSLTNRFSSKIEIKRNNRGRGNIIIPFLSDRDFERIIELLK